MYGRDTLAMVASSACINVPIMHPAVTISRGMPETCITSFLLDSPAAMKNQPIRTGSRVCADAR
jgi:hypothetical protein